MSWVIIIYDYTINNNNDDNKHSDNDNDNDNKIRIVTKTTILIEDNMIRIYLYRYAKIISKNIQFTNKYNYIWFNITIIDIDIHRSHISFVLVTAMKCFEVRVSLLTMAGVLVLSLLNQDRRNEGRVRNEWPGVWLEKFGIPLANLR